MNHDEFINWAASEDQAGRRDAMGHSWKTWLVAVLDAAGKPIRDASGHQVFESQSQYSARHTNPTQPPKLGQTLDLFA